MPILIHKPDGGADEERFEFDFDDLPFEEIVALEDLTGRNWGDIETLYFKNNFRVQGFLLLTLMRRTEPTLTIEQLDLRPRKVQFDSTVAEKRDYVERLLQLPDLSKEQRAAIEIVQKDLEGLAPAEVAEDPKATGPSA